MSTSSKKVKGDNLMVFINSGSGDLVSLAYSTSHTISLSADTTSLSTKTKDDVAGSTENLWSNETISSLSWEASSDCVFCDTANGKGYNDLLDIYLNAKTVTLKFGYNDEDATAVPDIGWTLEQGTTFKGVTGQAVITSLEVSASVDEYATYSVTFKGVGALTTISL